MGVGVAGSPRLSVYPLYNLIQISSLRLGLPEKQKQKKKKTPRKGEKKSHKPYNFIKIIKLVIVWLGFSSFFFLFTSVYFHWALLLPFLPVLSIHFFDFAFFFRLLHNLD